MRSRIVILCIAVLLALSMLACVGGAAWNDSGYPVNVQATAEYQRQVREARDQFPHLYGVQP